MEVLAHKAEYQSFENIETLTPQKEPSVHTQYFWVDLEDECDIQVIEKRKEEPSEPLDKVLNELGLEWVGFSVEIKKSARKELNELPKEAQKKVGEALSSLSNDAVPFGAKKLKTHDYFRLRCGEYRILYEVNFNANLIFVFRIRHRKNVYEGL